MSGFMTGTAQSAPGAARRAVLAGAHRGVESTPSALRLLARGAAASGAPLARFSGNLLPPFARLPREMRPWRPALPLIARGLGRPAAACALSTSAGRELASNQPPQAAAGAGDGDLAPASGVAYGQVVSAKANFVQVLVDTAFKGDDDLVRLAPHLHDPRPSEGDTRVELLCNVRALLKKIKQRVLVGDYVRVMGVDWSSRRGMVEDVIGRKSELKDPAVANVDHMVLMFAAEAPPLEFHNVSKFLVAAEAAEIPITLALNKVDLVPEEELEAILDIFAGWGYKALPISAATKRGIPELEAELVGRTSVVAGPSGVGKSSMINMIRVQDIGDTPSFVSFKDDDGNVESFGGRTGSLDEEDDDCGVGDEDEEDYADEEEGGVGGEAEGGGEDFRTLQVTGVSQRTGRGRHTTRHITLLRLPGGGVLADSPGFNVPAVEGISPNKLERLFPEIRQRIRDHGPCAFSNCTHIHEPGCVVRGDGEEGSDWDRYWDYVTLRGECEEAEKRDRQRGLGKVKRQGRTREKHGKGGVVTVEAKLESKKHRRESRRQSNQSLKSNKTDYDEDAQYDYDDDDDDDDGDDDMDADNIWAPARRR